MRLEICYLSHSCINYAYIEGTSNKGHFEYVNKGHTFAGSQMLTIQ